MYREKSSTTRGRRRTGRRGWCRRRAAAPARRAPRADRDRGGDIVGVARERRRRAARSRTMLASRRVEVRGVSGRSAPRRATARAQPSSRPAIVAGRAVASAQRSRPARSHAARRRESSAACTPPGGAARPQPQAHLDPAQRAGEHQVVEAAQMPDPEDPAGEPAQAGAERHVEALEDQRGARRRRRYPSGMRTRRQRARVLARVDRRRSRAPRRAPRAASPRRGGRGGRRRSRGPLRPACASASRRP